ncbi:MAG: hydrogenase expression/formation protein HypE [Deferrisomatales bacterium]|nr:hydrogenase expression/formation protein HypE [Deferrisomatales bacterium]
MSGRVVEGAHGGGGVESRELVRDLFLARLGNPVLNRLDDFGLVDLPPGRVALTTDAFVVTPWRFPGGNLGDLAVCGTVNDLAMSGARPRYLTAGFILPEGFPLADLEEVVDAMARRALQAGVEIVAGDTKVVDSGMGPFITTAGVGVVPAGVVIAGDRARVGDVVLLSGDIGRHGIAVLSRRAGLAFRTEVVSDVAPLGGLVAELLASGCEVHVLRDPTRGGVAGTLNEIAAQSGVEIEIDEQAIPVVAGVRSACDLLGFDPLHIANEGCMLAVVPGAEAARALAALQGCPEGQRAVMIGRVRHGGARVVARTPLGGRRLVDAPAGELLPRIC